MKRKCILLLLAIAISLSSALSQTRVIAHRGYWKVDGAAQNSIASLHKADSIDIYGSEMDVWLTADGVPIVNHDASLSLNDEKLVVESTQFERLRKVVLSNGEVIPTVEEYLDAFANSENLKLILEFKSHRTSEQERELATKVIDMVNQKGLQDRVEYIAFGINFINLVRELAPKSAVYYLNGDLTPKVIKSMGAAGIDYNLSILKRYPEWVKESHNLGLKVNVWTVNSGNDINEMLDLGVDFITTDEPILAKELINNRK